MLSEVQLRFSRKGAWLQDTSERHPDMSFLVASLYEAGDDIHLSLVVTPSDASKLLQLEREWGAEKRIRTILGPYEDPRGARFHFVYSKQYSTYPILVQHNLFSFRYFAVTRGSQYLSVIAESADVEGLVKDLQKVGTVELLSVRKVAPDASPENPTPIAPLLRNLSDMQIRAMLLAHDRGYYSWPRKVSASDLAKEVGLTVPSFLHHLRLGESELLSACMKEFARLEPVRLAGLRTSAGGSWNTQSRSRAKRAKDAA